MFINPYGQKRRFVQFQVIVEDLKGQENYPMYALDNKGYIWWGHWENGEFSWVEVPMPYEGMVYPRSYVNATPKQDIPTPDLPDTFKDPEPTE